MALITNLRRFGSAWRIAWLIVALYVPLSASGESNQVLVLGDASRNYFRTYTNALEAGLAKKGLTVKVAPTLNEAAGGAADYRCIVTVGSDAARELGNAAGATPVLHAVITNSLVDEIRERSRTSITRSYLLVEQPISRLVLLATLVQESKRRLGVLYGPSSIEYRDEVRRQIRQADLMPVEKIVVDGGELATTVAAFRSNADLLLVLPDPLVVNEGTAKTLILGSYLQDLPLIGYSQALVKAGALMAVYSTPEMLGRQSAELITSGFWGDPAIVGQRLYPAIYEVSVNYQVARSLNIDLPEESELLRRLKRLEKAR